jgi:membrane protein YdbS with pleckstrin-like domain
MGNHEPRLVTRFLVDRALRRAMRETSRKLAPIARRSARSTSERFVFAAALVILDQSDKTSSMAEETIWRGTSSQLKNLGVFILCVLFCWLIVPIFIGLTRYLQTKNHVFELTNERLKMTEGVFSKVTETLELYRVKDIEILQPFFSRMLGLENIKVTTSDLTTPLVFLEGIPHNVGLADKLRNAVETIRMQKNVREIDIE